MKRLLAAGFSRIFQICPCFRKKERGKKHLPEMTLLEWYQANTDYRFMMEFTELLICHIAKQTGKGDCIMYRGKRIDLCPPWRQITVSGAFEEFTGTGCREAIEQGSFDEIVAFEIEPRLGWEKPVFLYDYPREKAALSRLKSGDPTLAERFELYIGGLELCNAFSELTDPVQQKKRFQTERKQGNRKLPLPEKFLEALPHMPEASGNALGVDRLVMLFADTDRIDDVVAFVPEEL